MIEPVYDDAGEQLDTISLMGITAAGYHGVDPAERAQGQRFVADVILHLDTTAAAANDDLSRTVNYAVLAERIAAEITGEPVMLIETLAERIAEVALADGIATAADVTVHKPQAPITVPFTDVAVSIRRFTAIGAEAAGDLAAAAPAQSFADPMTPRPMSAHPVASGEAAAAEALGMAPAGQPPLGSPPPVTFEPPPMPAPEMPAAPPVPPPPPERQPEIIAPPAEPESAPMAGGPEGIIESVPSQLGSPAPESPNASGPLDVSAPPVAGPVFAPVTAPGTPGAVVPPAPSSEPSPEPTPTPMPNSSMAAPAPAGSADPTPTPPPAENPEPPREDPFEIPPPGPAEAVLALGANLGEAQATLRAAIDQLSGIEGIEIATISPLARTAPVGEVDQPDFYNAVVIVNTTLSPHALLVACQQVEEAFGRTREQHWGPRTLDIDLITYADVTGISEQLELPHPRAHERAFVLVPWSQAEPAAVLPGLGGGPVAALAETAPDRTGVRWLALDWLSDATGSASDSAVAGP